MSKEAVCCEVETEAPFFDADPLKDDRKRPENLDEPTGAMHASNKSRP
jgi:hypothetical protein